MAWNKRNLVFAVGIVVTLAFIGFVASSSFSGSKRNAERRGESKAADAGSKGLERGTPNLQLDNVQVAAAPGGTSGTEESPSLTLRCRAVIPSYASGDAETAIAYALQNELRASTNLFNPEAMKLGPEIHRDGNADTFTFNVTLALKRPLKL